MIYGFLERDQNIFLNKKAVSKTAEKRMYEYCKFKREDFLKESNNQNVQFLLYVY